MYDHMKHDIYGGLYKRALEKLTFSNDHTYIQYYSQKGSEDDFKISPSVNDFKEMFQKKGTKRPEEIESTFRLLVGLGNGKHRPLSLAQKSFEWTLRRFGFPTVFAESILSNNGSFASFIERPKRGDDVSPTFLSIILQTPNSHVRNFSCVMRINIIDGSATILHFDMSHYLVARMLQGLDEQRELLRQNPLTFLSVLYAEHGQDCETHRQELDRDVVAMERQTGMTSLAVYQKAETNYEQLTKRLHACNTNLIFFENIMNFEAAAGQFIKQTLIKLEALQEEAGIAPDASNAHAILIQNMDYLINASEMRRYQAQSLHRRVQTQINVLYSLISQRDSKVNISVAEASQKIAAAAKRDSSAMKTVSMLTLIFLPGTFVASVFSAGIFHLEDTTEKAVSALWWVYFVSSGILTVITLGIWALYMRWRSMRIKREEEMAEKLV